MLILGPFWAVCDIGSIWQISLGLFVDDNTDKENDDDEEGMFIIHLLFSLSFANYPPPEYLQINILGYKQKITIWVPALFVVGVFT